jgi:rhodanese-related sulfurtransferase
VTLDAKKPPLRPLAIAALALGVMAFVAGEPINASGSPGDLSAAVQAIERGDDEIGPVRVARWIRDGDVKLRLLDVRSPEEFAEFSIPGARQIGLGMLSSARFDSSETVVIYGDGPARPAQAWMLLRARGVRPVYVMRGGVAEWIAAVLDPILPADATPEERAAFVEISALSSYFGGNATVSDKPRRELEAATLATTTGGRDAIRRVKRRGC